MKKISDVTHPSKKHPADYPKPHIIPRSEHTISRKLISPNALKVLNRLHQSGYEAYLVGGCVRDLLLGRHPKDYDVATNAHPEEVRKLFKNCRLIGRRFRLAHILFGKEIIEVATFRTHHENAAEHQGHSKKGMIVRDNVYGSIHDDAWRRDFTINALYYNIADFSVVDYVQGMHDIQLKQLRMIGDPEKRFTEDPVRLLRAARIAGKLNLKIDHETETALMSSSHLLHQVSSARLYLEILKYFHEGATFQTFQLLKKYHLFQQLFTQTAPLLNQPGVTYLIHTALNNTDRRIKEDRSISPAFLFAVFLWPAIHNQLKKINPHKLNYGQFESAIYTVLKKQKERLDLPKRLQMPIREICILQYRFSKRRGKQPYRLLEHPRFRAGYDLLLLRAESGEPIEGLSEWWTAFYLGDTAQKEKLLKTVEE